MCNFICLWFDLFSLQILYFILPSLSEEWQASPSRYVNLEENILSHHSIKLPKRQFNFKFSFLYLNKANAKDDMYSFILRFASSLPVSTAVMYT